MFRNSRENRSQTSPAKPSTGRPPSPHPEPQNSPTPPLSTPVTTAQHPSTRSKRTMAAKTASPASTRKGSTPKPAAKFGQPKKSNGNIMSFFKKADSSIGSWGEAADPLFVDGADYGDLPSANMGLEDSGFADQLCDSPGRDAGEQDESNRFNESGGSSKRRRLSPPTFMEGDPEDVSGQVNGEVKDAIAQERPDAAGAGTKACSPPPHDFNDEENKPGQNGKPPEAAGEKASQVNGAKKRLGPFEDDSEDDEDVGMVLDPKVSPGGDAGEEPVAVGGHTTKVPLREEHDPDGDALPREASGAPPLRRQSTSFPDQDAFADFEGMGDFDDEYEEGDEFAERRWQMEQARLEMREGGYEGELGDEDFADMERIKEEEDDEPQLHGGSRTADTVAATCPICSASFAGVSDQEASVHVNHCLDGNPTPLPTQKQEVKQEAPEHNDQRPPVPKFRRPVRPAKPAQENPFKFGDSQGTSSAFSRLMSGHTEEAAWADAAAAENASRGKPAYTRTCPFYKIMPGFNICVDAFRYGAVQGCNAYFLSHFHSDHYIGLTSTWSHGPIYCSRPTANLVRQQLRVDPKYVVDLQFEEKVEVPGTNGVFVTMIPANHCPGSSLYLFEKYLGKPGTTNGKTQRVLHCGDFRACPAHVEHPLLKPEVVDFITGKTAQQKIDVCYLDTTYLNPKYAFPSQEDVIQACADMCVSLNKTKVDKSDNFEKMKAERAGGTMTKFVRQHSKGDDSSADTPIDAEDALSPEIKQEDDSPSQALNGTLQIAPNGRLNSTHTSSTRGPLLVVVGTYSIGKERICLGIARALNSLIYAPPGKQRICAALEDSELNSRLTSDPRAAQVHMTPLFEIRAETLGDYLAEYSDRFSRAVGFRPSGWNYRPPGSRFTESPAVGTVLYSSNWKSSYSMRDLVPQRGSNSRSATYGVPYSEHSSFRELTMFCCALRIEKVVPTVNVGSAKGRERMKVWVDRWTQFRKKEGLFRVRRPRDVDGGVGGGIGNPESGGVKREEEDGEERLGEGDWYPDKGTWELRTTL